MPSSLAAVYVTRGAKTIALMRLVEKALYCGNTQKLGRGGRMALGPNRKGLGAARNLNTPISRDRLLWGHDTTPPFRKRELL
jgi:hypothetical protein